MFSIQSWWSWGSVGSWVALVSLWSLRSGSPRSAVASLCSWEPGLPGLAGWSGWSLLPRVSDLPLAARNAGQTLLPCRSRRSGHPVRPVLSLGSEPAHDALGALLARGPDWSYFASLTSGSGGTQGSDGSFSSLVPLGAWRPNLALDTVLAGVPLGTGHPGQAADSRQTVPTSRTWEARNSYLPLLPRLAPGPRGSGAALDSLRSLGARDALGPLVPLGPEWSRWTHLPLEPRHAG